MAKKFFDDKKFRPRVSYLVTENIEYVDYKDIDLLRRFLSDRGKIRSRDITGNTIQQQKDIANAIKIAREMALLPYQVISSNAKRGRKGRFSKQERSSDSDSQRSQSSNPEASNSETNKREVANVEASNVESTASESQTIENEG